MHNIPPIHLIVAFDAVAMRLSFHLATDALRISASTFSYPRRRPEAAVQAPRTVWNNSPADASGGVARRRNNSEASTAPVSIQQENAHMDEQQLASLRTVGELQQQGPFASLLHDLQKIVAPLKVDAASYDELWEVIQVLQASWAPCMQGPFVSRRKELLYALNCLEGKARNDALGIAQEHYSDPIKAKELLRTLRQQIVDKTGRDAEAERAFKTLTEIFYNVMDVHEDADVTVDHERDH